MNKTIFQLDYKISLLIISIFGIIIGFVSSAYSVNGVLSFIFHFLKVIALTAIFLILSLMEKKNKDFKGRLKYMFGSLIFLNGINLVFAVFTMAHILSGLFLTLSGVVSLYMVLLFVFEIIDLYYQNKVIEKVISFNKKIGTTIADPIIIFFERITNG